MILVHTLAYNTPSQVQRATEALYANNKNTNFKHFIFDLGFPLYDDHSYSDAERAKQSNSILLQNIAAKYGSEYRQIENVGVSQNWTAACNHMSAKIGDVVVGADPDEKPLHDGYLQAMSDVIAADNKVAWISLMMKEQEVFLQFKSDYAHTVETIGGHKCYVMDSTINWAMGAFNMDFLIAAKTVPFHPNAPRYGWIETACIPVIKELGFKWVILADYYVEHLASPPLYGEWKQSIVTQEGLDAGQIDFETFLKNKHTI